MDNDNGCVDTTIPKIHRSLLLLENQDPSHLLCDAWTTLGWSHYYFGNYPIAYDFGLKALNLARDLELKDREAWALDAAASFNSDSTQSIQMHEKAIQIFRDIDDIHGQHRGLNNWACTLSDQGNYDTAWEIAHQSLHLVRQHALKREEINLSETISRILLAKGEYTQAYEYLQNALSLSDTCGSKIEIMSVYVLVTLGQVCLAQNDLEKAENQLNCALTTSIQQDFRGQQMHCHQHLSEVYKRQGKFDKALEHYKVFHSLKETVAGENSARQIAMLEMSHKLEIAQQNAIIKSLQNEKLQLEIDKYKRAQAILENLATRELIIQSA